MNINLLVPSFFERISNLNRFLKILRSVKNAKNGVGHFFVNYRNYYKNFRLKFPYFMFIMFEDLIFIIVVSKRIFPLFFKKD